MNGRRRRERSFRTASPPNSRSAASSSSAPSPFTPSCSPSVSSMTMPDFVSDTRNSPPTASRPRPWLPRPAILARLLFLDRWLLPCQRRPREGGRESHCVLHQRRDTRRGPRRRRPPRGDLHSGPGHRRCAHRRRRLDRERRTRGIKEGVGAWDTDCACAGGEYVGLSGRKQTAGVRPSLSTRRNRINRRQNHDFRRHRRRALEGDGH